MELRIEKLVYGGEGMGHADGTAVFVPFVLPGETVAVHLAEQSKKFARGRVEQLLAASPQRVPAPCPYFTRCGGCHYQHVPYEAQLEFKKEILLETLSRLGGIRWPGQVRLHASPAFGYRNRAQWKARRSAADAPAIGYLEAGTQTLCPVERCPILSAKLESVLARLSALLSAGEIPATLMEAEAFADHRDERLLLNASFRDLAGTTPKSLNEKLRAAIPAVESLLLHNASRDRFELFGPGYLLYAAAGHMYRVGHLSFFQVNRFLVDSLARRATEGAAGKLAVDVYAGVGLFSLQLAQHFDHVVAAEANPAATRDLEDNIKSAPAGGRVEARTEEAEDFLARFRGRPELVIVDPPRAGLSSSVRGRLASLGAAEIRYVSCDPATLARDLASLSSAYRIAEIDLFDLFPQSFHLETLVRLERKEAV